MRIWYIQALLILFLKCDLFPVPPRHPVIIWSLFYPSIPINTILTFTEYSFEYLLICMLLSCFAVLHLLFFDNSAILEHSTFSSQFKLKNMDMSCKYPLKEHLLFPPVIPGTAPKTSFECFIDPSLITVCIPIILYSNASVTLLD